MKITVIGVEVLEVDEQTFVMDEMRPRVPGRDVQLDQAIAGHPEGGDILDARPRIIIKVARWRDAERDSSTQTTYSSRLKREDHRLRHIISACACWS